jgi:Mrp family chromosome partitioning ATPase
LIDADLRRPSVHRAFGIRQKPGLIDCLRSGRAWTEAVQKSVSRGLDIIPSGGATNSAADLLVGSQIDPILREAEEVYDYVIVDAPALFINAADARVLAQRVDGVIVVVRSRVTPRALVDRIPRAVPNVIGVVVNDLRKDSLPGYYADYFAEYGDGGDGIESGSIRVGENG